MGLIFISHSSRDSAEAVAMRHWLDSQGWGEIFLDLDPVDGLKPGQRWRDELSKAGEHCSAVVVLLTTHWVESRECLMEFASARALGKDIFPVLVAPCSLGDVPELATYQFADISTAGNRVEGLERLRIGLLRAGLRPGAFMWPPKNEPNRPLFRGLRVLEEPDAAIFFGRDAQITKALDCIRRLREGAPERMVVILGASGAGKSSFLRAGLLARLRRDTERFVVLPTVRPGRAAVSGPTGLRHALGLNDAVNRTTIAARLAALRAPVVEHLRHHAPEQSHGVAAVPPTVLLPIDQAEELFAAADEEAAAAVAMIAETLQADPYLLLLLTIRSDSLGLLQGDPLLSGVPRLPFDLPRLPTAAFKEIIEGPTRLHASGIVIDADLTEQLIRDFDGADALPLLAFTLERLITDHSANGRIAKHAYLEEMKGMGGAIRKAVEVAFAKAAEVPGVPHSRADLDALAQRSFVPGLVRIDDAAAAPKRRVALRRQLPTEAHPLIDCLVDQRVLVADAAGTEPTIEVSHEAVLRHWRELAGWIAERRADLSLGEHVMAAAALWRAAQDSGKNEALVHRGERLRRAERLLLWFDLRRQMGDDSVAYLAACRAAETQAEAAEVAHRWRQRRLRQWIGGLVAAAGVVTVLGAALVLRGQRNLGRAQSLTLARASDGFAKEDDYVRALRLSILAARGNWLMPVSPEGRAALSSSAQGLKLSLDIRGHTGGILGAVFSKDETRILTWSADGTARLWNAATGAQVGPVLRHDAEVSGAVFSKDESRILTWSADRTARLWNAATGAQVGPALRHNAGVSGAVFSKDETRILTWSVDGSARLWNVATRAQVAPALRPPLGPPFRRGLRQLPRHNAPILGAVFSKDETRILTWSTDGTARLWNAATGTQVGPALRHIEEIDNIVLIPRVSGAVFSRDEIRILTWSTDQTARLWNATTGAQVGPALRHDGAVSGAVFSKNETRILTWSADRTARLWNAATGAQVGPALRHDGDVSGAVFSQDESRILTWSDDQTARLWNAATGAQVGPALRHNAGIYGAVFSKDETRILTWSADRTARLWNAATGAQLGPALRHDDRVSGAVFSKDESRILTWSVDQIARVWDAATAAQVGPALTHGDRVSGALFSKDETRILTWSDDQTVRLWNAATGAQLGPALRHEAGVSGAVFSKDETRILTWSADQTAQLWNAATGAPVGPALRHDGGVSGAVFSKDESRILTWSADGTARFWNAATGTPIGPTLRHDAGVAGAMFSKDETRILTWTADTARLWNAATGAQVGSALSHGGEFSISGAVFSKGESRILTWSTDDTARLWNAATGTPGPVLRHIEETDDILLIHSVSGAAFSRDETRILTWSTDGTARLWNAATGAQVGQSLSHDAEVSGAVFSKDETRILTWSDDGTARLWAAATGTQAAPAFRHNAEVSGAVFSKDESRILTWSADGTARLWNATTGAQVGPAFSHDGPLSRVSGAVFSKDETRILTWSDDHTARLWNVRWAMRDPADTDFVADICRDKLVGPSFRTGATPSMTAIFAGARHLDARDTAAAPILRDREGEDVCGRSPTTWDTLRSLLRSPAR